MKTKLLKELRGEAYKEIGIKNKLPLPIEPTDKMDGVYIIGLRNYSEKDIVEFSLKEAKKRLHQLRIDYCIRRVQDKRIANNRIRFCRF